MLSTDGKQPLIANLEEKAMSSIVVLKSLILDSTERFEVSLIGATSIESAAKWLSEMGAENDQEIIDLIVLDDSDPGIVAIDAYASSEESPLCPVEALLKRIFLAGYRASEEERVRGKQ